MLGAGDTFRAAAVEQLTIWADRLGVPIVKKPMGADPASVAFDAVDAAVSRGASHVIIDTAGRLHTQQHLMAELEKITRVIRKRVEGAPHEVLLVLDATSGQNMAQQAELFSKSAAVTGILLAKLDGTAKGARSSGCASGSRSQSNSSASAKRSTTSSRSIPGGSSTRSSSPSKPSSRRPRRARWPNRRRRRARGAASTARSPRGYCWCWPRGSSRSRRSLSRGVRTPPIRARGVRRAGGGGRGGPRRPPIPDATIARRDARVCWGLPLHGGPADRHLPSTRGSGRGPRRRGPRPRVARGGRARGGRGRAREGAFVGFERALRRDLRDRDPRIVGIRSARRGGLLRQRAEPRRDPRQPRPARQLSGAHGRDRRGPRVRVERARADR